MKPVLVCNAVAPTKHVTCVSAHQIGQHFSWKKSISHFMVAFSWQSRAGGAVQRSDTQRNVRRSLLPSGSTLVPLPLELSDS